ncbi:trace amine-associated receptor 1-like, partial [Plectropomus leopardus]|uniref:trace amine-associated receptor 1-like n=1 Tax=Plectropomus leopardus TaxID=160734 RepID=UPI001C4AA91C
MRPEGTFNGTFTVDDGHPCFDSHDGNYVFTSHPSVACVLLYIFLGLLSLVTVCGNLLVVISIIYFKQLHMPTNYLILSLAVADLLVGSLVCPLSMAYTVTSCRYNPGFFYRYYAVCQPLFYKTKITDRVTGIMILISWFIAAVIGFGIMVEGLYRGRCGDSCLINAVLSIILACIFAFYIPAIVMLSIYLKIFLVAQKQANSIQNTTCQNKKSEATVSKMERKATKTLAIVMGVFLVCWTPFFFCISFLTPIKASVPLPVFEIMNWITLVNSMF